MKNIYTLPLSLILFSLNAATQDTLLTENWSAHFQLTLIEQAHLKFMSPYAGMNSLKGNAEEAISLTSTLFIGRRLWKSGAVYINPEVSGGKGISGAVGIAGFSNGETVRIGDPAPTIYLARFYLKQYFALKGSEYEYEKTDANQLSGKIPSSRITITAGKFAIPDIFDNNNLSHDPRSQFINWSLMSNGAWDYPANTRGYSAGACIELIKPNWAVRFSSMLMPKFANGPTLDGTYFKAHAETAEWERKYRLNNQSGIIRILVFRNASKAPVYREVINNKMNGTDTSLNVVNGKKYGGIKYGWGINTEQSLGKRFSIFFKASWNDGKTATWAFTEIDQSISLGFNISGERWRRTGNEAGIAFVNNGISNNHKEFLNIGGYGFIIGDGKLPHYGRESIAEVYYNVRVFKYGWLTWDYQFVKNPGYNKDRGPVHIFSIRAHIEL